MKTGEFLRHLRSCGCFLKREGGNHTIYVNSQNGEWQSVPRHREIDNQLVRRICRKLEISHPWKEINEQNEAGI